MPTSRGWATVGGCVACYLGAWFLGYAELAVLGTGCLAALALGALGLVGGVPLRVRREVAPVRVTRGEQALGLVTVTNQGRWSTRPLLATDHCGGTAVSVRIPRLRAGAPHTSTYFLPTHRRGELAVGPLRLIVTDPLGLFRRSRTYGAAATLLVHPRTVPLDTPPSGHAANVEGPTSDTAPGGTVTFHTLREYVFGDDLRYIHWRTSARTGTLMMRHLIDSSLPQTVVLLDNRGVSYVDEERFELAVDIAASVLVAATRAGFPVALATTDSPLWTVEGGRAGLTALLRRLALVRDAGPASLVQVIPGLRPGGSGGSLTVVTGRCDPAELDRLAAVRARFDRALLVRVGADRPPLPAALPVTVLDANDLAGFTAAWRRASAGGRAAQRLGVVR
jgi:uncharacterized protein (DUF58 family)